MNTSASKQNLQRKLYHSDVLFILISRVLADIVVGSPVYFFLPTVFRNERQQMDHWLQEQARIDLSHTQRHPSSMCAKIGLTIRGRLKLWEENMMVCCMIRRRNGVGSCWCWVRIADCMWIVECSSILYQPSTGNGRHTDYGIWKLIVVQERKKKWNNGRWGTTFSSLFVWP